MLTILAIVIMTGCGQKASFTDEMIGTWKRSDAEYKGAFFELTADKIIIGTLKGEISAYTIKNIRKEKVSGSEEILYNVTYADLDGSEFKFPFYFDPKNGGKIRLQNQPEIIWTKEKN